jgi:hypothetical protein
MSASKRNTRAQQRFTRRANITVVNANGERSSAVGAPATPEERAAPLTQKNAMNYKAVEVKGGWLVLGDGEWRFVGKLPSTSFDVPAPDDIIVAADDTVMLPVTPPLRRSRPIWFDHYRVIMPAYATGSDEPGPDGKPRKGKMPLVEVWRSCKLPNVPEVCSASQEARRTTVIKNY